MGCRYSALSGCFFYMLDADGLGLPFGRAERRPGCSLGHERSVAPTRPQYARACTRTHARTHTNTQHTHTHTHTHTHWLRSPGAFLGEAVLMAELPRRYATPLEGGRFRSPGAHFRSSRTSFSFRCRLTDVSRQLRAARRYAVLGYTWTALDARGSMGEWCGRCRVGLAVACQSVRPARGALCFQRCSRAVLGASAHLSSRFGHPIRWPPDEMTALWDAGRRAIHFC